MTSVETSITKCEQADCPIARGGRCLEGFEPPSGCSHYIVEDVVPADFAMPESTEAMPEPMVALPDGGHLTDESVARVLRAVPARVVVLAGSSDAGKTTILTSIYELLRQGGFADWRFAGSKTLAAFERRCHDSRGASGRERPVTAHTGLPDSGYLHLRLKLKQLLNQPINDLIFTDFPGEFFDKARDSKASCQKLTILQRADHIAVLVDGEKLASSNTRHNALENASSFIRSCIDADMCGTNTCVELVISKSDLLQNADAALRTAVTRTHERLAAKHSSQLARIDLAYIAARPDLNRNPIDIVTPLPHLLKKWLTETHIYSASTTMDRSRSQAAEKYPFNLFRA